MVDPEHVDEGRVVEPPIAGERRAKATRELGRCLAFALSPTDTAQLRERLHAGGWPDLLRLAEQHRLTPALADAVTARLLTVGIPPLALPDGRVTVSRGLADSLARHHQIRAAMRDRLIELAALLNAEGIEPILLKGARSLWTGTPSWRTMGDLDLLVPGAAPRAQQIALAAGYTTPPGYENPEHWHHELNLYRGDLPGWLEFHDRAAMVRADILLPTPMLVANSLRQTDPSGAVVRILSAEYDLLHCAIHHHISHRGDKFGVMSVKGLYEFAAGFAMLTPAERQRLAALAAGHPRLLAIFDLWLAASADLFALPVSEPFGVQADAARRWGKMQRQGGRKGTYAGVFDELMMGISGARLRRAKQGNTFLGRQKLRLAAISALLSPSTIKPA